MRARRSTGDPRDDAARRARQPEARKVPWTSTLAGWVGSCRPWHESVPPKVAVVCRVTVTVQVPLADGSVYVTPLTCAVTTTESALEVRFVPTLVGPAIARLPGPADEDQVRALAPGGGR